MSDSDGIHDLEYGTGIVSLARSQWSVMALSRDLLEWSPIQGGAEGKIKMSIPGRALQFVEDESKSVQGQAGL
jgi:hypothetical protein